MRIFIIFIAICNLQGCIAYSGTYYSPVSDVGEVIEIGHCGDNTPSKLILNNGEYILSIHAKEIFNNFEQSWIWLELESVGDNVFDMVMDSSSISFTDGVEEIFPNKISIYSRSVGYIVNSNDFKFTHEIPSTFKHGAYHRIIFKFNKKDDIEFRIDDLKINKESRSINVKFKMIEIIRMMALNC